MSLSNPEIFRWARETAGLSLEDAARAFGLATTKRLLAIESGEEAASRPLVAKMAKQYHRSLLTFYLPTPPKKGDRGEDFRTVSADRTVASDALLDALIRDLRTRQSLVRSTLEEEDFEPIALIGSVRLENGVQQVVSSICKALQFDLSLFREKPTPEAAFAFLRQKTEEQGIFVLLAGNLGSHHTAIPVEAFRGFAIADPVAPFIVINDQDAQTAWSFTLAHEIAHLFLGATGISGVSSSINESKIEQFCNEVAGEFLLPKSELIAIAVDKTQPIDALINSIAAFAKERHISRAMVAYKLFRAGVIEREMWQKIDSRLREMWISEKAKKKIESKQKESAVSYYVVRRHRLGRALLDFADRAVNSGVLSPVKAARVLGVKPRSVYPLLIDVSRTALGAGAGSAT
jgi:Zn-dependent peptidase ImmA (M78 family)/transcriptional regulator with XRE-family HTH domain